MMLTLDNDKDGPACARGNQILQEKGILVVGLSPDNSYFKKETIDELLRVSSSLAPTRVMIPYGPAMHSYKALGYPQSVAERKARLNCNRLRNQSQQSIDAIVSQHPERDLGIIDWKNHVDNDAGFLLEYKRLQELYQSAGEFRADVQEATGKALASRMKPGINPDDAGEEGKHYLLKELAFLLQSPRILHSPNVAYVYHRPWPVFISLIEGKYGQRNEDIGFLVIR